MKVVAQKRRERQEQKIIQTYIRQFRRENLLRIRRIKQMTKKITFREGDSIICPFCKQARMLTHSATIENTPEEMEALGALECGCGEARIYQNKKKSKDNVPALLDSFIEFCQFGESADAATQAEASTEFIKTACFAVIDGKADKLSFSVKEVKVKLSLNKDKQLEMKLESKKSHTTTT